MMRLAAITILFLAHIATIAFSFSMVMKESSILSKTVGVTFGIVGTTRLFPAYATVSEETPRVVTRMGGLLEKYQDIPRGWSILAPSGWNKFDGEVGAYDTKWQDIVQPNENIKLSTTPVKSTTTSIDVLGDVEALGESLAVKRNSKLIKAVERQTEEVLFYDFEFAINDGTHQLLTLCVKKGKIWSLDASSSEKRWSKRKELYENV